MAETMGEYVARMAEHRERIRRLEEAEAAIAADRAERARRDPAILRARLDYFDPGGKYRAEMSAATGAAKGRRVLAEQRTTVNGRPCLVTTFSDGTTERQFYVVRDHSALADAPRSERR